MILNWLAIRTFFVPVSFLSIYRRFCLSARGPIIPIKLATPGRTYDLSHNAQERRASPPPVTRYRDSRPDQYRQDAFCDRTHARAQVGPDRPAAAPARARGL